MIAEHGTPLVTHTTTRLMTRTTTNEGGAFHMPHRPQSGRLCMAGALAALSAVLSPGAAAFDQQLKQLKAMSLEELADLQVSIISKRPERLADSAAAVYVITAEDIRRSGYTSIPELLRLVPGFNVARIDTAEWAITSRGFNGLFANKLLVMIDGRSVYTPLFSGVFWESFDTLLEDIERIEVIRGPGASSWGANAVNGVVNVITKHAGETQGTLVSGYAGNQEQGIAVRQGGAAGERGYLRLYAKYDNRLDEPDAHGTYDKDDFNGRSVGFRGDWDLSARDNLSLQGDLAATDSEDPEMGSGSASLQWEHARDSGAADTLRLSYDRNELETSAAGADLVTEDLDTIDAEYRHRLAQQGRHDINLGLGYRWYRSSIAGDTTHADPAQRDFTLLSAFVQDEIALIDERWYLTVGTKLEHNDFTGIEIQPSVRSRWNLAPSSTLWGAVSRAVRTPSRGERDVVGESSLLSEGQQASILGSPVWARATGSSTMVSEELIAYELGYRWRPAPVLGIDLAAFYNDYDDLRTIEYSNLHLELDPYPRWVLEAAADNQLQGRTYGLDLVADWRPSENWRLQAWYSVMQMDLEADGSSTDPDALALAGRYPQQQAGLRIGVSLRPDLELDLYARYVDQLPDFDVDAYTELDARIGWRVGPKLTLALVGRNLLAPSHLEYGHETLGSTPNEIAREVMLRVEMKY
jgi:iron complex outermembrane recepter protein